MGTIKGLKGVELAREHLAGAGPGSLVLRFTLGLYSLIDVLRVLAERCAPADVILFTWTAGIRDLESADWLVQTRQIRSLQFCVDQGFMTTRAEYARLIMERYGESAIVTFYNHAKVLVVRGSGLQYCVTSSMNLNRNDRMEQYVLREGPEWCEQVDEILRVVRLHVRPGMKYTNREITSAQQELFGDRAEDAPKSRIAWAMGTRETPGAPKLLTRVLRGGR